MSPASGDLTQQMQQQGYWVSIQLMSPASGDKYIIFTGIMLQDLVSIQLMSPASGDD